MTKDDEKIEIIDTEIKERIGFASLLYNRLYTMDQAFDSGDQYKIKESLYTCFDDISPYLDKDANYRIDKKLKTLKNINDKDDFFEEAHKIHRNLLKILRRHRLLMKEVPK